MAKGTYEEIWEHANNLGFQGRCRAALWDVANEVLAGTEGFPAAGQESEDHDRSYATRLLRNETKISNQVLAQQVLRSEAVVGDVAGSTDADIQTQINTTWAELRGIQ